MNPVTFATDQCRGGSLAFAGLGCAPTTGLAARKHRLAADRTAAASAGRLPRRAGHSRRAAAPPEFGRRDRPDPVDLRADRDRVLGMDAADLGGTDRDRREGRSTAVRAWKICPPKCSRPFVIIQRSDGGAGLLSMASTGLWPPSGTPTRPHALLEANRTRLKVPARDG